MCAQLGQDWGPERRVRVMWIRLVVSGVRIFEVGMRGWGMTSVQVDDQGHCGVGAEHAFVFVHVGFCGEGDPTVLERR